MTSSPLSRARSLMTVLVTVGAMSSVVAADIRLGAAEALSGPASQYGQSIRNGHARR